MHPGWVCASSLISYGHYPDNMMLGLYIHSLISHYVRYLDSMMLGLSIQSLTSYVRYLDSMMHTVAVSKISRILLASVVDRPNLNLDLGMYKQPEHCMHGSV